MRFGAVLAVAFFLTAGPAWAQRGAGALDQLMLMDFNGDGAISRAEAQRGRTAQFDRLDSDDDGYLSDAERSAGGRATQAFARADGDSDGRISRAEAMAAPYRGFDRLDSNSDGSISSAEIEAVRGLMGQR